MIQCRAYHAGQNYYVELDIIMSEDLPLKVTHDVGQTLQRKLEGMFKLPSIASWTITNLI